MTSPKNVCTAIALLALAFACGCGQRRHDVSGLVAYADGQPFSGGGILVFEGTVAGKALMARGKIEPDGRFTLSAGRPGQGVIAGSYGVRLIPPRATDVDSPAASLPYDKKFLDCKTSGLAVDVGQSTDGLVISLGERR